MNMEEKAYAAMDTYLTKIEGYKIIDERDVNDIHYISAYKDDIIEIFKATYAVDAWSSTEFKLAEFEWIMTMLFKDHPYLFDIGIQRGLIHLNIIEENRGIMRAYHYGSDV